MYVIIILLMITRQIFQGIVLPSLENMKKRFTHIINFLNSMPVLARKHKQTNYYIKLQASS